MDNSSNKPPRTAPVGALSANSSDYPMVGVYFEEDIINELFCELLQARGVKTSILPAIKYAHPKTKIITEPQFFPQLTPAQQTSCLLVGNKPALKELPVLALSRPLTEEKVEWALHEFLKEL